MKKYLKLFIFIMIIIFTPKVFAANVTSKIEALPNFGGGTYSGYTPVSPTPVISYYNVNTRYNGTLSEIVFYLDADNWDWNYNKTYTITLNMATEDWRNYFMGPQVFGAQSDGSVLSTSSNLYVSNTFKFVSKKTIKFNFKTKSTMSPYLKFVLYSTSTISQAFTGVSNWNLSSINISQVTSSTPTPAPVTPTPTPTPQPNNQDIINNQTANTNSIINNQTQNTEDIITNNSQNTSDIIENNNSNTQEIINNTKTCYTENNNIPIKLYPGLDLTINGPRPNINWEISSFIPIYEGVGYGSAGWSSNYYCIYDINFNVRRCSSAVAFTALKDDAFLVRNSTIAGANNPRVWGQGEYCVKNDDIALRQRALESKGLADKQQETNDKLNDINSSINNDNIDNGVGSGFFNDFEDNQHGLTGIITAPLSAIQSITSKTCQPLQLPIPFTNSNVSLPCMTQVYNERIPTIYNIWKVVSFGIIAYFICLDIFHIVKGFKDPESDKVEVLDL